MEGRKGESEEVERKEYGWWEGPAMKLLEK